MRRVEDVTTKHARRFIFRRLDNLRDARRHIAFWLLALGALIGAAGIQLYWYGSNYHTTTGASDGIYAEGVVGPVDSLNPLFSDSKAEEAATRLIFSGLFTYNDQGVLVGDLARSMSVDKSGTVYTVNLREDILWHDGFRVTANDVAFTVDLLKNPDLRTTSPEDWSQIKVAVKDDQTLTFTLPAVIAAFPQALTFPILPRHVLSSLPAQSIRESEFSTEPVGSGPFRLRLIQDTNPTLGHKVIYLERNPDYYRGKPKLERLQLHVYSSNEAVLDGLSLNEINAAADLNVSNIDQVDDERYAIESTPIQSGVYAILNTSRDITKDKNVRRALQLGLDTKSIRTAYPEVKPGLDLPLLPGQLTGNVPSAPAYDKAKAESTLDAAGWKKGTDGIRVKDGKKLQLTVASTKDANLERTFEAVVGQWRSLGVQIDTLTIDLSGQNQQAAQDILQGRSYDAIVYQLNIGADPDVYVYWHSSQAGYGGLNLANYQNDIVDDALSSARSRLESNLRNAKYMTFVKQWLSDVPAIGLYQSTSYYTHRKNDVVMGAGSHFVTPLDRYSNVLYWTVGKQTVYKTP